MKAWIIIFERIVSKDYPFPESDKFITKAFISQELAYESAANIATSYSEWALRNACTVLLENKKYRECVMLINEFYEHRTDKKLSVKIIESEFLGSAFE